MPTEKSKFAIALDNIQKVQAPLFKSYGFKKKGRTYNKTVSDGLIQVINFQMGQYPLGENYVLPGLRENLYGHFAVNIGIFVPCIQSLEHPDWPQKTFEQEYDCQIRERLGIEEGKSDKWWDLKTDTIKLAEELTSEITLKAIPFFNQFDSYQKIIDYFDEHKRLPFSNENRSQFEVALIYFHLQQKEKAISLLREAYKAAGSHPFAKHVQEVAERIGMKIV